MARALLLIALLVASVAACATPVALRTAPTKVDACEMALIAGELVASSQSGLAIRGADGITEVLWPFGYTAIRETAGLVLRDPAGKVVAREGQRVEMGGGLGANNVWTACAGTIREVANLGG